MQVLTSESEIPDKNWFLYEISQVLNFLLSFNGKIMLFWWVKWIQFKGKWIQF